MALQNRQIFINQSINHQSSINFSKHIITIAINKNNSFLNFHQVIPMKSVLNICSLKMLQSKISMHNQINKQQINKNSIILIQSIVLSKINNNLFDDNKYVVSKYKQINKQINKLINKQYIKNMHDEYYLLTV
ncbi:hypothetical protein ABPG72_006891 [Tetrahymena utriculariae]